MTDLDAMIPPCPTCERPMARVAGPAEHRGWTCVNCNAAGDPEEDHLDGPSDPEPCSCDEALALKTERDTFREMAQHRGDLLVSELERRLAETRARDWAAREVVSLEKRLAEATALLERLRASTWQTGDLALPRDVRDFLAPKAGGS
jgi:hypothetical protein